MGKKFRGLTAWRKEEVETNCGAQGYRDGRGALGRDDLANVTFLSNFF